MCPQNKKSESGKDQGMDPFHTPNFLDCVRTRKDPNATIEIGHAGVRSSHLGNISFRQNRTIRFDPVTEKVLVS